MFRPYGAVPYQNGKLWFRLDWAALLRAFCGSLALSLTALLLVRALLGRRRSRS